MRNILIFIATFLSLASYALHKKQSLNETLYDYELVNAKNQKIFIDELIDETLDTDVILVGEWHSHSGIHLFQSALFSALASQHTNLALSMEQFSRSAQSIIDDYLSGKISEQTLILTAKAWPNYQSDYRPLVEFAKDRNIDIIAANAPFSITRCLAKKGIRYLDTLSEENRQLVAKNIDTKDSAYKEKFFSSMPHLHQENRENQFLAQKAWDDTMAESIVTYLKNNPEAKVMHIAGAFHVAKNLGIAASIQRLAPDLKLTIISPIEKKLKNTKTMADYKLVVNPLPNGWLSKEEKR